MLLLEVKFLKMKIQTKQSVLFKKLSTFNKKQKGKGIKTLTSKQMPQRLPIAIAEVKVGNAFENLLTEICQIIYSLCQEIVKYLIVTDYYSVFLIKQI